MNLRPSKRAREKGWALLLSMTLAGAGLLLVASVMSWCNENSTVVARNNEYFSTTYAAEAATEKALCAMVQDDQDYGEGIVFSQTAHYAGLIPTASDSSYWTNFQFSGGTTVNHVIVQQIAASATNVLGPPYQGLISVGATYDIIANAKNVNSIYGIESTVGQKINFGQIPIFQFAIFYQDTMEIDPGANMNITGLVHGNTNMFLMPNSGVTLEFYGDVSASGTIDLSKNPLDPSSRPSSGPVDFTGTNHISNVNTLNLPVGTNTSGTASNMAMNVLSILQVPPSGENPNSAVGTNRLYNQVDMIITISNGNSISVTSGVDINGQATVVSNGDWSKFVSTNGSFYDGRNASTVDPVDIDVGNLRQWSATNTTLRPTLSSLRGAGLADISSVYVVDQRMFSNSTVVSIVSSYTTNYGTITTASLPTPGNYFSAIVTNTLLTTSSTYPTSDYIPPPAASITTNFVLTTVSGYSFPPADYVPPPLGAAPITNTSAMTSSSSPTHGSYIGTPTYSGGKYHYTGITGYTVDIISGYIYTGITGYTYTAVTGTTPVYTYTTNWTQFAMPGVVLTNGAVLPPNGLSIATPDPAYISGNWNVQTNVGGTSVAGTSNVLYTLPSGIYADAITVLSPNWNPANNTTSDYKTATTDTVNAAFLTGNVPSNSTYYSGGVENFPRFLENWGSVNFYYNGSMVEMFPSQIANAPWPNTGTVYSPPNRNWTFDTNFQNPADLPPLTPKVIYLQRTQWSALAPGAVAGSF